MTKKIIPLFGILVAASLLAACGSAAAAESFKSVDAVETQPPSRTISVSGSGKAILSPDIAYINIGVHTESKDAAEAVSDNTQQAKDLKDTLVEAGVDESDIQTINFSIYPRQEYDSEGKPTGEITYIVDNSVQVTVRDLDNLGELLNQAVASGANMINGIQFDVADKTEALSKARLDAVKNAHTIAEELAQAAEVTLGEVQSISTYTSGLPTPMFEGRGGAEAVMAEAPVPISPGQMVITIEVSVVYFIE